MVATRITTLPLGKTCHSRPSDALRQQGIARGREPTSLRILLCFQELDALPESKLAVAYFDSPGMTGNCYRLDYEACDRAFACARFDRITQIQDAPRVAVEQLMLIRIR